MASKEEIRNIIKEYILREGEDELSGVGGKGAPRKNPQDSKIVKLLDDMFSTIKATNSNILRSVSDKDGVGKLVRGFIYRLPQNTGYSSDISSTDAIEFLDGFDFPVELSKYQSNKKDSDADGVPDQDDNDIKEVDGSVSDLVAGDVTREKVKVAFDALKDVTDERLLQSLRSMTEIEDVGLFLLYMIQFINQTTPAPNLTKQLAHQFIDKSLSDDFDSVAAREKYTDKNNTEETDSEEDNIEEMSTTAGAPAPATKYAFKRKK